MWSFNMKYVYMEFYTSPTGANILNIFNNWRTNQSTPPIINPFKKNIAFKLSK